MCKKPQSPVKSRMTPKTLKYPRACHSTSQSLDSNSWGREREEQGRGRVRGGRQGEIGREGRELEERRRGVRR